MKAHHLVVYLSAQLPDRQQQFDLCAQEVDGAAWLSREHVWVILQNTANEAASNSDSDKKNNPNDSQKWCRIFRVRNGGNPLARFRWNISQTIKSFHRPGATMRNSARQSICYGRILQCDTWMGKTNPQTMNSKREECQCKSR